jgi:hypothetical protein
LRRPVARRLGTSGGAEDVKQHIFFKGVDWDDVLGMRLKPPFVPVVKSPDDVSNFDVRFTSKAVSRESDEKAAEAESQAEHDEPAVLFPDFEYVSPEMRTTQLDDKILSLQDLRIRGFGNP